MSEFRVGSAEWKLENRTSERNALQESVDRLKSQLAAAEQRIAELENEKVRREQACEVSVNQVDRLQDELETIERQLTQSRERERKLMAVIDEINDVRPHDWSRIPHRVRRLSNEFLPPAQASAEGKRE